MLGSGQTCKPVGMYAEGLGGGVAFRDREDGRAGARRGVNLVPDKLLGRGRDGGRAVVRRAGAGVHGRRGRADGRGRAGARGRWWPGGRRAMPGLC